MSDLDLFIAALPQQIKEENATLERVDIYSGQAAITFPDAAAKGLGNEAIAG